MVLVDFTLAERWRVFGELSLASVRQAASPKPKAGVPAAADAASAAAPVPRHAGAIDPQESAARREAQAAFMQRML